MCSGHSYCSKYDKRNIVLAVIFAILCTVFTLFAANFAFFGITSIPLCANFDTQSTRYNFADNSKTIAACNSILDHETSGNNKFKANLLLILKISATNNIVSTFNNFTINAKTTNFNSLMFGDNLVSFNNSILCDETPDKEVEDQLEESVLDLIDNLDLTQIEQYFSENSRYFEDFFGIDNFKDFLLALISGEILTDFNSVFSAIISSIKTNLSTILSPLIIILIIVLIAVVFKNVRPQLNSHSVEEVVFFICFSVVAMLVILLFSNVLKSVSTSIEKMQNQMNAIFPILLLLMTSAGASVSVKAFQPLVLLLSNTISNVFVKILLPISVAVFVLALIDNISTQTKVKNLSNFFSSAYKWIIGIMFTVYTAFLSLQGITASSADGISIKTAKYAIKNYIPMLGGYISDGFEVARVGSLIIKNAVGFSGIILLLFTTLSPIIMIGVLQLSLKLFAAFIESISDTRTSNLLMSVSKSLSLLMTVVLGVAIMYFVVIFLLMCCVSGAV